MSAKMLSLARSQDIIGLHNFTEGHISIHFYDIQHFNLAMHSSYLSGTAWTKQFISRILHIIHSQWIFRNISLHNRSFGYIHNKQLGDITSTINELVDTASDSIPLESQFLLDINFSDTPSNLETKTNWILAINAALAAKRNDSIFGSGARRAQKQVATKIPSWKKLGITEVKRQIRLDKKHLPYQDPGIFDDNQLTLERYLKRKQPHPSSLVA